MADQIIPDLSTKKPYDSVWSSVLGTLNLGSDMKFISTIKTVGREVWSMRIWECRITRSLIEAENNDCMTWGPHENGHIMFLLEPRSFPLKNLDFNWNTSWVLPGGSSFPPHPWTAFENGYDPGEHHISSLGNIWVTDHAHMAPFHIFSHVFILKIWANQN